MRGFVRRSLKRSLRRRPCFWSRSCFWRCRPRLAGATMPSVLSSTRPSTRCRMRCCRSFRPTARFLVQHVTDPRSPEAKIPAERRNDFIQLDHYGQFPFAALPRSYTAAVAEVRAPQLEAHGVLPWQIGLYSKKLTDAFRAHDWDEAKIVGRRTGALRGRGARSV